MIAFSTKGPLTLALSPKGRGNPARLSRRSNKANKNLLHHRFSLSLNGVALPLPLGERAGVRGFQRPINSKRRRDLRQHAFDICENLVVPKSQNTKAFLLQPGCSLCVYLRPAIACVLAAVLFNDKSSVETAKIGNIWTDGSLSAEFDAFEAPVTQQHPHLSFGVGLISSEQTCSGHAHKIGPLTLTLSPKGGEGT